VLITVISHSSGVPHSAAGSQARFPSGPASTPEVRHSVYPTLIPDPDRDGPPLRVGALRSRLGQGTVKDAGRRPMGRSSSCPPTKTGSPPDLPLDREPSRVGDRLADDPQTRIADELRDDQEHVRTVVRAATLGTVDLRSQRLHEAQREGVLRRLRDGLRRAVCFAPARLVAAWLFRVPIEVQEQ